MNQKEFTALLDVISKSTTQLLISKGAEYASDTDRLANFKLNAERLGLSPLQVWAVYAFKHVDAIQSYSQKIHASPDIPVPVKMRAVDRVLSEPIEGRFHDLINYMILGLALLEEMQKVGEVGTVVEVDPEVGAPRLM